MSGQDKENDNNQNNDNINLDDSFFEKLAKAIAKESDAKDTEKDDASNYEDLKNKEKLAEIERNKIDEIKNYVSFDNNFDSFIKTNSKMFTFDSEKIRSGAVNLTGKDLSDELKKISAKDFFSLKDNISLLSDSDKLFVSEKILGASDRSIDADKAWNLIKSAVNVKNKQNIDGQYRRSNDNNIDDTKNVSDYIKNCIPK